MELDSTAFHVTEALDYGLSQVRERAAAHGITLRLEVSPDVHDVEADPLRFKQVVLNLVSNAVKFTGDGGQVTVRARHDGEDLRSQSPIPESASRSRTASASSSPSNRRAAARVKARGPGSD